MNRLFKTLTFSLLILGVQFTEASEQNERSVTPTLEEMNEFGTTEFNHDRLELISTRKNLDTEEEKNVNFSEIISTWQDKENQNRTITKRTIINYPYLISFTIHDKTNNTGSDSICFTKTGSLSFNSEKIEYEPSENSKSMIQILKHELGLQMPAAYEAKKAKQAEAEKAKQAILLAAEKHLTNNSSSQSSGFFGYCVLS